MLYVFFGSIHYKTAPSCYVNDIDGVYNGFFNETWNSTEWAKRVIKEIDKSDLIAPKIIESPLLRTISHEWLSGGTKQLIMMQAVDGVVFNGDNLGDNCWPLLLELSKTRDIVISLYYFPGFEWPEGCELTIINNDKVVSSFDTFTSEHCQCDDTDEWFEFNDIDWPLELNYNIFKPAEIDFLD